MNKAINIKIFVLIFGIGVLLLIIMRWIGFDGLYGQDAYSYAEHTLNLQAFLTSGEEIPPFHWPSGYPILCLPAQFIFNNVTMSLQITSMLFWSLSLFMTYKLIMLLHPEINKNKVLVCVLILLGGSPYFLRLGFSSMSDVPSAFFCIATFYHTIKFKHEERNKYFALALLFSIGAVFTRYAAGVVVSVPLIYGMILLIQRKNYLFVIGSALLFFVGLSAIFLIKDFGAFITLISGIFNEWKVVHFFQSSFLKNGFHQEFNQINLLYVLKFLVHPGFFFFGVVAIYAGIRKKYHPPKVMAVSILIYLLFLGGLTTQNSRFFILVMPILFVVYLSYLFQVKAIFSYLKNWYTLSFLAMINLSLFVYSFKTTFYHQQNDLYLSYEIAHFNIENLYSFEVSKALPIRGFDGKIYDLWYEQDLSFVKGDYFLLNKNRWSKNWSDHLLIKQVDQILANQKVKEIKKLEGGWSLYKYE